LQKKKINSEVPGASETRAAVQTEEADDQNEPHVTPTGGEEHEGPPISAGEDSLKQSVGQEVEEPEAPPAGEVEEPEAPPAGEAEEPEAPPSGEMEEPEAPPVGEEDKGFYCPREEKTLVSGHIDLLNISAIGMMIIIICTMIICHHVRHYSHIISSISSSCSHHRHYQDKCHQYPSHHNHRYY